MQLSRRVLITARVATAIFVSAAVAAGVVVAAPAAYAGTDDYPAQWKSKARDAVFDSWGEYNRECTSWVAWRLHGHNQFEMPFHANAGDWGAKAKKLGYTINMTPAVGSVAWWNTSSRGHVAWVEAVYPNNTVEIEEYNIGGSGKYDQTTIPTASVTGYIHFQDLATSFSDGQYVIYGGDVYRMAGGAPLYVSSWGAFGKTPAGLLSATQWASLPRIPKDGTLIQGATSKRVYRIVGGAPLYLTPAEVTTVAGAVLPVSVPDATISNAITTSSVTKNKYDHLAWYPSGSAVYVQALPSKNIYQIVGREAIPVPAATAPAASTPSTSAPAGTAPASTTKTPTTTTAAVKPTVTISDADIANAGAASSSPYSHLLGYIGLPTPVILGTQKLKHTLRASLGTWNAKGFTIKYTWYRNGVKLPTIHGATYTPHTAAAIGKKISVSVSVTRTNFVPQTHTSAPTVALPKS